MTPITEEVLAKELLPFYLIPTPAYSELGVSPMISNSISMGNHNKIVGFLLAHGYVPDKELYNLYKRITNFGVAFYLKTLQKLLPPVNDLEFTKESTFDYLSRTFNYKDNAIKQFEQNIKKILYDIWTTGTTTTSVPQFQHVSSFKLVSGFNIKEHTLSQSIFDQLIKHSSKVDEIEKKFKPYVESIQSLKILSHINNKYALVALLNLNVHLFYKTDILYIDLWKFCKSLYNLTDLMNSLKNKELLVEVILDMCREMPQFHHNISAHVEFWKKFIYELSAVYQIQNKDLDELYLYLEDIDTIPY